MLGQLADVPDERRGAAFVCAARWWCRDGERDVVHGEWTGHLVRESAGTNGFGYDPIFVPDGEDRTSAELAPEEKDARRTAGGRCRAAAAPAGAGRRVTGRLIPRTRTRSVPSRW